MSVNTGTTENRVTVGDGAFERLIRGSQTEYRHFISANGRVVAIVKRSAQTGNKKFYLHADHLGSTDVITDETSAVYLRISHDAWGQRRGGSTWSGAPTAPEKTAINASTHRGYTGHEQLDNLNLVHMKGRVYDPVIARFMSADPIIQSPFRSQSFNRYSYVWNNPLNATDPTGFCLVTGSRVSYDDCEVDGFGVAYGVRYGSGSGAPGVRESGQIISLQADTASTLRDAGQNSAQRGDTVFVGQQGNEHIFAGARRRGYGFWGWPQGAQGGGHGDLTSQFLEQARTNESTTPAWAIDLPEWASDPDIRRDFARAWQASRTEEDVRFRRENGGFAVQRLWDKTGDYSAIRRPPGVADMIPMRPPQWWNCLCTIVGQYHTHPLRERDGYDPFRPSPQDLASSRSLGVPGVIITFPTNADQRYSLIPYQGR